MKILLVNPSIPFCFRMYDYADDEGKEEIGKRILVGPPLGLNDIAGMLKEEDVIILDQKAEKENDPEYDIEDGLIKSIKSFDPEIVGFTCIASQFNNVKKLAKIVKKYCSKILTVVGGIHPTSCPNDFLDVEVDILVMGLGKVTFSRIVNEYKKNRDNPVFDKIDGLALKNNKQHKYTRQLGQIDYATYCKYHLRDDIYPNRTLTERYEYRHPQTQFKIHYLSTSIGCTHKCNFCYLWKMSHGRYKYREVETIINEIKTMEDYEIIRFCDSNTFGDIKKAKLLFTRMKEESFNHIFVADVRTDTIVKYPETIRLASDAGIKLMIMGLEATSDEELKRYGKTTTIEDTTNALRIINESGVYGIGNYIVDPSFSEEDFERAGRFIMENPVYFSGFTILTPFPGTKQWEMLKDKIVINNLDYYNLANAVIETKLPEKVFYQKVSELYKLGGKSREIFVEKYQADIEKNVEELRQSISNE